MPIEVEAPDGTVVEFPDGTPDSTISNVMGANYGVPVAGPDGQTTIEKLPSAAPAARSPMERFQENRDDAYRRGSIFGAGGDFLAATVLGPLEKQRNKDDAELYALHSQADPWYRAPGSVFDKAEAGASTLAGQVAGTLQSPESLIAPGRSLFGRMLGGAAVQGALDPAIQGIAIGAGSLDHYDPMRTAGAAALGAGFPVAGDVAGHLARVALRPLRPLVDPILNGLRDAMPQSPDLNAPHPAEAPSEAPRPASRSTHPASPPENTVSRDPVTGDWIIDVNTSTNPEFEAQRAQHGAPPAPVEASTWTPEREAAFLATHGVQPPDAKMAVGAEGYQPVPVPSPTPEAVKPPVAAPEPVAPPKRVSPTYLAPDGFPATEPPVTLPGHYVVRAEPDGTHTLINKTAGWSPVQTGLGRDEAMAAWQKAEADLAAPKPQPTPSRAGEYVPLPDHETIDLPGKKGRSPVASISLHQREDGTWASGYDYTLPSSGGASPNDGSFATRDEAVAAAAERLRGRIAPYSSDTGTDAALKAKINGWLDQTAPKAPAVENGPGTVAHWDSFRKAYGNIATASRYESLYGAPKPKEGVKAEGNGGPRYEDAPSSAAPPAVPTPEEAAWLPSEPSPAPTPAHDTTDAALDLLRAGKTVRVDQGPSLAEYVARNGALAPSPELSALDAEKWHRAQKPFTPRLVREGGQSLEAMAQRAHEAGYFPEVAPPTMAGGENMHPVSGDMLVDALRRELAGSPRFSREASPETADLARHADELEQMLHELGLDPQRMSNAEIKQALNDYFNAPDKPDPDRPLHLHEPATEAVKLANGSFDQGLIPGVGPSSTADRIRAEQVRRGQRGGSDAMPEGGLFDETAKAQGDLLDHRAPASPPEITRDIGGRPVALPDEAHAALYDFGVKLRDGASEAELAAQADKLRSTIGRYMDWSEDLAADPRLRSRFEGARNDVPPRKLIYRAARDYAEGLAHDPAAAHLSLYDPERTGDLLRDNRAGARLRNKTGGQSPTERIKEVLVAARSKGVPAEFRGVGPAGPQLTGFEGHWPEAVDTLRSLGRGDLVGALFHPEVGPIDVIWGDKHSGLAHILGDPRRASLVSDLPSVLAETHRLPEGRTRAVLESDTHRFVIALNHFGEDKRWLLTGYERKSQPGGGTIDSASHEGPAVAAPKGSPDQLANPNIATDAGGEKLRSLAVTGRAKPVFTGKRTSDPGRANAVSETLHGLAVRLKKTMGVPVRRGHISGGKRVTGHYTPATTVIRLREAMEEFNTFAHESGHAAEGMNLPKLKAALKAHAADLRPLAYPGAPVRATRQEGFAEFFRWYLTNPTHAQAQAPKFYTAFEAALEADKPSLLADLRGIQSAYQEMLNEPSANLASASMVRLHKSTAQKIAETFKVDGAAGVAADLANSAYRGLVDELNPLGQAVKTAEAIYREAHGKKLDLKAADNPYVWGRLAKDAYGAGFTDITRGVVPASGVAPEGASLSDAMEKALGAKGYFPGDKFDDNLLSDFDAYLLSRRNIGDYERYKAGLMDRPPDQYSLEHWQAVRDDFEAKHPHWVDAAPLVHEFAENLWKKRFEEGFITEKTYLDGLAIKDYVPANRDMSDLAGRGNKKTTGDMQHAGGANKRVGSDRPYVSPIQSLMREAFELNAMRFRNRTFRALADLAKDAGPAGGAIMEKLPLKEIRGVTVDVTEALEDAARRAGMDPRDMASLVSEVEAKLSGETAGTVYRGTEITPKGEPIVFVWRDGQKEAYRLPDGKFGAELYTALSGVTDEGRNPFIDFAAVPSQMLRYGITSHPKFMLTNYVRDQLTAWINAEGFFPFIDGAKGVALELRQGKTPERYAAFGGAMGGSNVAALPHARATKNMQVLRKRGIRIRQLVSWNGFAHLSEITETGTRLGVFRASEKRAMKDGLSPFEAAVEGAYNARDYVDFSMAGRWVKHMGANRIITFMNAGIQSVGKAGRVATAGGRAPQIVRDLMRGEPLTRGEKRAFTHAVKWWTKVSALGVLGLTLRAIYQGEPEYEEVSDYLRDTHWIIGAPSTQTVSGWRWYAFPKPFELAAVSNIMERAYERYAMDDPTAWSRLRSGLWNILAPPHEIPALSLPFQVAKNRDTNGRPIIPDYLKGKVQPQDEVNAYNSALSKKLGQMFNWSPAVIDYTLSGLLGYWGKDIQGASDLIAGAAKPETQKAPSLEDGYITGRFVREPARGSTSQKRFYQLVAEDGGEYTRDVGTVQAMVRDHRDAEIADYMAKLEPQARAYVAAEVFGSPSDKAVHPLIRAQAVTKVLGAVRGAARDGQLVDLTSGPIKLTPQQLQKTDEALTVLINAEQRDALIAAGEPGWAQKEPIDIVSALRVLNGVNPAILRAIDQGMAAEKVLPDSAASVGWDQRRAIFEGAPPQAEQIGAMATHKRTRSRAGKMKEAAHRMLGG